ncbi:MAG TPA: hypothetical protein VEA99_14620 [Gemmatimonadaceae bacterium]|nr:hypothetical protein [Gemmatimonadaceae bacterium]
MSAASAPFRTTPSAAPVGATTAAALRCWLQAQQRAHAADGEGDVAEIRRTMRRFAEAGRQRGAPVEQLIVLLKELWTTLPSEPYADGRRGGRGVGTRMVLERIIRTCIEEYYAARPATGPLAGDRHIPGGSSGEAAASA